MMPVKRLSLTDLCAKIPRGAREDLEVRPREGRGHEEVVRDGLGEEGQGEG